MHTNQHSDKIEDRTILSKSVRNQRLDRPGDLKIMQLLSAYPDNKIKLVNGTVMIPVTSEDARTLGLRVPDTDNFLIKSNSTSSRSSALLPNFKSLGKRLNDDSKSKKDVKRHRNVDAKTASKLPDLKQERKAQRTATLERLSNLHAKLGQGLRNISNKTKKRQKVNTNTTTDSNTPASLSPPSGRSSLGGKLKKNSLSSQNGKLDELRKESSSKSTRQLFSMADSWSSDSVVSHSDNCDCCHNREPCPFHRNDFFGGK